MEWFDRVLAKRDDAIPSFMNVDAINSYVDKSMQLDQPEMTGTETASDIALGFAPGVGTAMGFRDFERARRDDDKLGMGLGILSMIPVAGGAVRTGRKGINKILDELDMSKAARMKRAKDMGFDVDTTYYHGTGNAADIADRGFDPALTGRGNDQYGSGYYFSNRPETASGYATDRIASDTPKLGGESAPGVIPAHLRFDNPLVLDANQFRSMNDDVLNLSPRQVRELLDHSDALKRGLDAEDMNPMGDHYESFWSDGPEDWMLDDLSEKYSGQNIQYIEHELFDDDPQGFRDALTKVTGHDGVIVKFDSGETHAIPWNSRQIRSVNAAFDPAKKDSANLLAGFGALGLGVGGAASMFAPQQANASDEPWYEKVLNK